MSSYRRKKRLLEDDQRKEIESYAYLGFSNNELSDLPHFLEAPQLLNTVTNAMGFKVKKKTLNKFIDCYKV